MRIGYVLKKFPRTSETFILNEILELQRQGADVTIFSLHRPEDGVFHAKLSELAKPVVYVPQQRGLPLLEVLQGERERIAGAREELFEVFDACLRFKRRDLLSVLAWGMDVAIRAEELGIEHLHAHFATIATQVARAAHALTGIGFSFTCHAKDIYRETVLPEQFQYLATAARFSVTVCDANREHVMSRLAGTANFDLRRLYNGIDLSLFHPKERQPDEYPLVLGIGRLVEKKGFRYLIDAIAALRAAGRDCRCVILGEGDARPELEERIRATGCDAVELRGICTQEEVREYMRRCAMLVLPCLIGEDGNRDALPTVLLEAQASAVPVISCPVAGVAEIVDSGEAGLLVPEHDADALTKAIGSLLENSARREELGRKGRERAEEFFDLSKNVGTLRSWFEEGARG